MKKEIIVISGKGCGNNILYECLIERTDINENFIVSKMLYNDIQTFDVIDNIISKDIKLIHVVKENLFEAFVNYNTYNQVNKFHFQIYAAEINRDIVFLNKFFNKSIYSICYEDIINNWNNTICNILKFLKLEPVKSIEKTFMQYNNWKLYFSNTILSKHFDK